MAQPHPSTSARRFHPGARDAWTARLRRATSWLAVGSVGLVAALVGLAAHETPPHHVTGSPSPGTAPATGATGGSAPVGTEGGAPATQPTGSGTAGSPGAVTPGSATTGPVVSPGSGQAHVSTGLS